VRAATSPPVLAVLLALAACERPAPPAFQVAGDAAEVSAPAAPLNLQTSLAALPAGARAELRGGDVVLYVAYDGMRLMGEAHGVPAADGACPTVARVATDAGKHRHSFRFGTDGPVVRVDGGAVGGNAPRAQAAAAEVVRFSLPALGGDAAFMVTDCRGAALLPPLVAALQRHGGLRWSPAAGPAVIGAAAFTDGVLAADMARFQPGDEVALIGNDLGAITAIDVGGVKVTPDEVHTWRLLFRAPADGGDSDVIVPYVGDRALGAVSLPIEGTIHRIGDAMGEFVGMVWSDWLVFLLVGAGLLLTIVNGFPQFRGFKHALYVVRGHYDNPSEQGEITHFQALTAALSATVGLGNIAGVAVAVTSGGPGAIFWMWVCGFLGMATKYSECALSTATRDVREDGTVAGGPMYYMRKHLPAWLKPMAFVYAVFITISSFGGGNMFQANQAAALWQTSFGVPTWVTGLILVALVGLVIVGGIKRIGRVTDKLVPAMVFLYVGGALAVIFVHIDLVPGVFGSIFSEAWSVSAAVGGTLGIVLRDVLKQGFRRAAFSNEAGFGSAAIAHAAVKTDEPVREGVVALLEPFVDTIVICTMTGLVILISGVWTQQGLDGAPLTAAAFDSAFDGFGSLLVPTVVFLFAVSTMISWSYYGEKGVEFFLGRRAVMPYRLLFVGLVFVGAVWKLGPVLDFSDAMFGLVAVPNLIALFFLAPRIRALTKDYFGRLKSGQMVKYK
jgi:AGCS family alanine or glycine:cation symporter